MPSHRDILETWFRRVWTEEDETAIDEMMRPDTQARGLGDQPRIGPEAFKVFHRHLMAQLTDFQFAIDHSTEDGDWIWALCTMNARRRNGDQPVRISGQLVGRLEDGRLAEAYNHWDFISLFQQLELVPANCFERCLCGEAVA